MGQCFAGADRAYCFIGVFQLIRLILRQENIMEDLKLTLKTQIIEALNLQGMTPADIDDNAPLFGEGLGLDSIDSLEMMVLLERNYGIKIEDAREGRKVLESVNSMAEYIQQHRKI
jgi:acyl carrier protein